MVQTAHLLHRLAGQELAGGATGGSDGTSPPPTAGQELAGGATGGSDGTSPPPTAGQELAGGATGGSDGTSPPPTAGQELAGGATGGSDGTSPPPTAGQELAGGGNWWFRRYISSTDCWSGTRLVVQLVVQTAHLLHRLLVRNSQV